MKKQKQTLEEILGEVKELLLELKDSEKEFEDEGTEIDEKACEEIEEHDCENCKDSEDCEIAGQKFKDFKEAVTDGEVLIRIEREMRNGKQATACEVKGNRLAIEFSLFVALMNDEALYEIIKKTIRTVDRAKFFKEKI